MKNSLDILIIGGGGSGGANGGGGGGSGGIIYTTNCSIPKGNYTIKVGNGGIGTDSLTPINASGSSSEAFNSIANGGGRGGGAVNGGYENIIPNTGGSGGGGNWNNIFDGNGATSGTNFISSILNTGIIKNYNGYSGGYSPKRSSTNGFVIAGGGGGAVEKGNDGINVESISETKPYSNSNNNNKGKGGDGILINIIGEVVVEVVQLIQYYQDMVVTVVVVQELKDLIV